MFQLKMLVTSLATCTLALGACSNQGGDEPDQAVGGKAGLSAAASQKVVALTNLFGIPTAGASARGRRAVEEDLGVEELLEGFLGSLDDLTCATQSEIGEGAYHLELSNCQASGLALDGVIDIDFSVVADCSDEVCTGEVTLSVDANLSIDELSAVGSWQAAFDFEGSGTLTGQVSATDGESTADVTLDATYGADGSCQVTWSYADSSGDSFGETYSCE